MYRFGVQTLKAIIMPVPGTLGLEQVGLELGSASPVETLLAPCHL